MTGYGQAELEEAGMRVKCEIRALNGRYFEADLRLPKFLYELDPELRKILSEVLERGTITCIFNIDFAHADKSNVEVKINKPLARSYHEKLKELSSELGLEFQDPFREIARNQDIINLSETEISDEVRDMVKRATRAAAEHLNDHREKEGANIVTKLLSANVEIEKQLRLVENHEEERRSNLREKIYNNLAEHLRDSLPDQSRFEQELLLYLEKWDIAEEKHRLQQHITYFGECLEKEPLGKKLNFIAQEMGREINTLGVKSNHYGMQQATVLMKEQLEQIKEQVLNIV